MDDFKEALEKNIKKFQDHLQCIRMLLDITMSEAGELLGVSRQSIMALEAGSTKMSVLQYVCLKSAFYRIYTHTFNTEEKNTTDRILNSSISSGLAAVAGSPQLLLGITGITPLFVGALSRLQKKFSKQENSSRLIDLMTDYGGEDAEEILGNALSLRDINDFYDACHKKTREQRNNTSKDKELKREIEELKRQLDELTRLTRNKKE